MIQYFTIGKKNMKQEKKLNLNKIRHEELLQNISILFTLFIMRKAWSKGDTKP